MSELNHTSNDLSSVEHAAQLIEQAERIDGIVASVMALGRVIANQKPVELYSTG